MARIPLVLADGLSMSVGVSVFSSTSTISFTSVIILDVL